MRFTDLIAAFRITLAPSAAIASCAIAAGVPQAAAQWQRLDGADVHRVLVIPVNLAGRAPVTLDRAQILQALYGTEDSVASRYRTISYGKVEFAGSDADIVDPVTLTEPTDLCNSGLKRIAGEDEDEAERRGIPHAAYQHFVFVIPHDAPCWWTGVGDIGGNRVWVKATTAKALQHELGHNLGMNHAVNWRGSDAEESDFMGSGGASLNAPHVVEMGWLRPFPGKVIELTGAGDVTLEALEADPRAATLPKVAIVRPTGDANTYYLSYRAASTANPLPADITRGLNIHIASVGRQHGALTFFVSSLSDGASYRDGPMILQQISHIEGVAVRFHLSFAGTSVAMPAGPPPAPPGTVQSAATGKCLDLPGGQHSDGTPAIQYDCHGGANQQWSIEPAGEDRYRIISRMSGKCIGTEPGRGAGGGSIVQSNCGAPEQLWVLEGSDKGYVVRNLSTRLCLDVPGASVANGTKLIGWTCNGGTNQTWRYRASSAQPTP